jgi:hypothetical protein
MGADRASPGGRASKRAPLGSRKSRRCYPSLFRPFRTGTPMMRPPEAHAKSVRLPAQRYGNPCGAIRNPQASRGSHSEPVRKEDCSRHETRPSGFAKPRLAYRAKTDTPGGGKSEGPQFQGPDGGGVSDSGIGARRRRSGTNTLRTLVGLLEKSASLDRIATMRPKLTKVLALVILALAVFLIAAEFGPALLSGKELTVCAQRLAQSAQTNFR